MKTTIVEFPPQSFVLRQPAERTRPIGVNGQYSCEGQPFKMAHSERGQRRRRTETEDRNGKFDVATAIFSLIRPPELAADSSLHFKPYRSPGV